MKWLLIVNTAVFILTGLLSPQFTGDIMLLALAPVAVVKHFAIWQLATYLFLHGGVWHLVFNMLTLWMFGTPLERDWGTRRFLKYYFICGIGAGLCDVLLNAAIGNWHTSTIGASGAIYGLLLAFGVCYPDQTVLMNFLFPIKAKYMVMIYAAIELWMSTGVNSGSQQYRPPGRHGGGVRLPEIAHAGHADQAAGLARRVSPMETAARQEEVPGLHEEARPRSLGELASTRFFELSRSAGFRCVAARYDAGCIPNPAKLRGEPARPLI